MNNSIKKTESVVNSKYTVDILHFLDGISVLDDLLIELGYEIQSSWEDGRIHIDSDSTLLEASIVNSQGEVSIFLKITMQDLVRNATETIPYLKKANPLEGAAPGNYTIIIRANNLCVFLQDSHNYFLFSITPMVKMYVDGASEPAVEEKYPLDCNLVGNTTTGDEIVKDWSVYYKEG